MLPDYAPPSITCLFAGLRTPQNRKANLPRSPTTRQLSRITAALESLYAGAFETVISLFEGLQKKLGRWFNAFCFWTSNSLGISLWQMDNSVNYTSTLCDECASYFTAQLARLPQKGFRSLLLLHTWQSLTRFFSLNTDLLQN